MAFAWGLISLALGISALVKSNHEKALIAQSVPSGASVSVSNSDILGAGTALITACGILSSLSLTFLLPYLPVSFLAFPFLTLPLQAHLLAFMTVFIFASAVPATYFIAQHQAKVNASIDGFEIPAWVIQVGEKLLGVTAVYNEIGYLRLIAIIPWMAFLFALISTIATYMAAARVQTTPSTSADAAGENNTENTDEKTAMDIDASRTAATNGAQVENVNGGYV